MQSLAVAALLFWTAFAIPQQPSPGIPLSVRIDAGEVNGALSESSKVRSWLGIPFAKSPPERFGLPEPPKPWTTPLNATREKPACIQQFTYPEASRNLTIKVFSNPLPLESEDCLYVNVWSPSKPAPAEGWPVMFWIYGGNLQFGHGLLPIYRGERMTRDSDTVVVTFNYRTNVFGFPGSPTIAAKDHNLGFLDQRKALAWVKTNIAQFSGNPDQITIFGESAGGFSTKQLLANPPKDLLDAAIKTGKSPFAGIIMQSQASGVRDAHDGWKKLVLHPEVNCKNETSTAQSEFECVKAVSASTLKNVIEKKRWSFGPTEDGITFAKDVRPSLKAAHEVVKKTPIIIGTNSDEGTPFITIAFLGGAGVSLKTIFASFIGGDDVSGGELADALLSVATPMYDKKDYSDDKLLGSGLMTDVGFQCSTNTVSRALVEFGFSSVRRYLFRARFPKSYPYPDAGAYHGSEVEPVFGTYDIHPESDGGRPGAARVSKVMMAAWTGLGKGKNAAGVFKDWPELKDGKVPVKVFDVDGEKLVDSESIDSRCDLLGPLAQVNGV